MCPIVIYCVHPYIIYRFEFDGETILEVEPSEGGFWEMGGFEGDFPGIDNPWEFGDKMAPFDREVSMIYCKFLQAAHGYFIL